MKTVRFFIILFCLLLVNQGLAQKPIRPNAGECIHISSCDKIDSLVALARTKNGKPYVRAGSGPNSFDCSGFTMWVYGNFGVDLPHGSITQYKLGKAVERKDIRPGDLVFFYHSHCVGHVGLVTDVDSAGAVTFIHASTYKTGVKYSQLGSSGYGRNFYGARRIFECDDSYTPPAAPIITENQQDSTIQQENLTAAPAPLPEPACTIHHVSRGETVSVIAKRYNVTIAEVQQWNNLASPDRISVGQQLKIYPKGTHVTQNTANTTAQPATPQPQPVYHKIKSGETLGSIAKKYHTTVSKLQKLNNMGKSTFLREGKRIRVK